MAELRITTGDGEERVLPLTDQPVSFGRAEDCDVSLAEQKASRRHCRFLPVGDGWRVVDDQSSNGTWLGGKPVLSARLQPGDEIEIGETVIEYFGKAATTPRAPRVRRRRLARTPWEALVVPVALLVGAFLLSGQLEANAAQAADAAWAEYARDTITLAELTQGPADRAASLARLADDLERRPAARRGYRLFADAVERAQQADPATVDTGDTEKIPDWQRTIDALRSGSEALSAGERRSRMVRLLERNRRDPRVAAAVRELLIEQQAQADRIADGDLVRVRRETSAAIDEGRLGEALSAWNSWVLRAPTVTPELEREVADVFAAVRERSVAQARDTVARYQGLVAEGRPEAARAALASAQDQLRGTSGGRWLDLQARLLDTGRGTVPVDVVPATVQEDAVASERARGLRELTSAENLARVRRFADAAERLTQAAGTLKNDEVRGELLARAADLRLEAALLDEVVARVAADPRKFSPMRIEDGAFQVLGASGTTLTVSTRGESAYAWSLDTLPGAAFVHLFAVAKLEGELAISAALVLHDIGETAAADHWMRIALANEALQQVASSAYARMRGELLPLGGYVPHPKDEASVISYEAYDRILNDQKIVVLRGKFEKLVERIEGSKQATGITKVAAAYAALEKARTHALELIFDEVKYFYPYRDRMAEYAPVQREVDERVKKVVEAWEPTVRAQPKKDKQMAAWLDEIEDLEIEIGFLSGEWMDLAERYEAIERYLDRDLTVRTFFITTEDADLIESNQAVMLLNVTETTVATEAEVEQVRVTNEYRMMLGHRPAVRIQDQLTKAARGHSADMARLGFFDHFSPVEGKYSPNDRVRIEGYFWGASENIHMGSTNPLGAHNSWIGSSGHHRNLLSPAWTEMGTGQSGRHWTQNFSDGGN